MLSGVARILPFDDKRPMITNLRCTPPEPTEQRAGGLFDERVFSVGVWRGWECGGKVGDGSASAVVQAAVDLQGKDVV